MATDKVIRYCGGEKKEISKETLQAEMAQYLQMDNLSFLVGAGCSSNIVDGKETGIPGMAALYRSFFEEHPDFEVAGEALNGQFDQNLEKMLEVLGAIHVVNQVREIEPGITDKMKTVRSFIRKQIALGIPSEEVKAI